MICLQLVGDDLYIGGVFEYAGDKRVGNIVRYHLPTRSWHSIGNFDGMVRTMVVIGDSLYAAGWFDWVVTEDGDSVRGPVDIWDLRRQRWYPVVDRAGKIGFSGFVRQMVSFGGELWIAGSISTMTQQEDTVRELVRWDGRWWNPPPFGKVREDGAYLGKNRDSVLLSAGELVVERDTLRGTFLWNG